MKNINKILSTTILSLLLFGSDLANNYQFNILDKIKLTKAIGFSLVENIYFVVY